MYQRSDGLWVLVSGRVVEMDGRGLLLEPGGPVSAAESGLQLRHPLTPIERRDIGWHMARRWEMWGGLTPEHRASAAPGTATEALEKVDELDERIPIRVPHGAVDQLDQMMRDTLEQYQVDMNPGESFTDRLKRSNYVGGLKRQIEELDERLMRLEGTDPNGSRVDKLEWFQKDITKIHGERLDKRREEIDRLELSTSERFAEQGFRWDKLVALNVQERLESMEKSNRVDMALAWDRADTTERKRLAGLPEWRDFLGIDPIPVVLEK